MPFPFCCDGNGFEGPRCRSAKKGRWWARQDSNLRQRGYEPRVLTAELQAHTPAMIRGQTLTETAERQNGI